MTGFDTYTKLFQSITSVVKGQDNTITQLLSGFAAVGHILLEDAPGNGKITLAKALAFSADADFKRIQFTPDLLPSDVCGVSIFDPSTQEFRLYRAYSRLGRFGFWKKNKFSMPGIFLIYALILPACLGLDTFRSMVYQLFSLLFSMFAVSAILSFKSPKGLWAKRILPEYATAGTPVSYTIRVENRTDRLKKGVEIHFR